MGDSITTLLVRRGMLPVEKLDRILQHQVIFGGTVDTAVLELGYAKEIPLIELVVEATGFPAVNLKRFQTPDDVDHLRRLIPFKMVKRHGVLPVISQGPDKVGVLVLSSMDSAKLEELAFLLGVKIEARVTLEVRFWQIAQIVYGTPPDPRFERLIQKLGPIPFYPPRIIQSWFHLPAGEVAEETVPEGPALDSSLQESSGEEFVPPVYTPKDAETDDSAADLPLDDEQQPFMNEEPEPNLDVTEDEAATPNPPFEDAPTEPIEDTSTPPFEDSGISKDIDVTSDNNYENNEEESLPFSDGSAPTIVIQPPEEENDEGGKPLLDEDGPSKSQQSTAGVPPDSALLSSQGHEGSGSSTITLERAASIFNTSDDRDEVILVLLEFALTHAAGALFAVMSRRHIHVKTSSEESLEGREIPLDTDKQCIRLLLDGQIWSGISSECPVADLFDSDIPPWFSMIPLKLNDKVIGFLGVWGDEPSPAARGELRVAAQMASSAFMRIILARKKAIPVHSAPETTLPAGLGASQAPDPDALIDRLLEGDTHAAAALRNMGMKALLRVKERFPGKILDPADHPHLSPRDSGPLAALLLDWGVAGAAMALELLRSPDEEQRYYAAFMFQEIKSPEVIPILGELLYEDSDRVLHMALETIRSYRNDSSMTLILEDARQHLTSHDTSERKRAIKVLEFLGDLSDVSRIASLLKDPELSEDAHRALISITLHDLGTDPAVWKRWAEDFESTPRVRYLIGELSAPDATVRHWTIEELKELTGQDMGYNPEAPEDERHEAVSKWMQWWYMEGMEIFSPPE